MYEGDQPTITNCYLLPTKDKTTHTAPTSMRTQRDSASEIVCGDFNVTTRHGTSSMKWTHKYRRLET
jgi:hypothetical protein